MGAAFMTTIVSILLGYNSVIFTLLALRIIGGIHRHMPAIPRSGLAYEADMPSVTVCIPARNEEHALAECLQRVINSTYEKLEIIVLDDASSDTTSLLIKSFAHAGVRFVRGAPLPGGWLGKNHALKELASTASGSYILFIDVDTRLSPVAIEYMVRTMLAKGVHMLSVLPRRQDGLRLSVLWSPLRYYWELVRNSAALPATASNAWIIKRSHIVSLFKEEEGMRNAVLPEEYAAKQLGSEYDFVVGTSTLGVSYEKKWRSQCETSIRLLYPSLGMKTAPTLLTAAGLLLLLSPYVLLCSALWTPLSFVHGVAAVLCIAFGLLYAYYARTLWNKGAYLAFFLWPCIMLQEVFLILTSFILYKRGRVLWKGRPVRSVQ